MGGRARPGPFCGSHRIGGLGLAVLAHSIAACSARVGMQLCLQSCRLGRAAHLQTVALGCALITPGVLLDQMGAGLRDLALE
jgi:hypothetical protein